MKRSIAVWQLAGFAFTAVLGTLLHFLFGWTNSPFVAIFSAVNESTWEHIKLFFFPAFAFAIFQARFFVADYPEFWYVKLIGIVVGCTLIPVLFYTYNGAFGRSPDWLNIVFFFIAAGIPYLLEGYLFKAALVPCDNRILPISLLLLLAFLFAVFTFYPPRVPLFQDPIFGSFGIHIFLYYIN